MISSPEKEKLQTMIGSRHIAQLAKYLAEKKIKNRHGQDFSRQYISRVFNGLVENTKLEKHIYDFAAIRKIETASEKKRRKEILEGLDNYIGKK